MYRLLYRSKAVEGIDAKDVFAIVAESEGYNPEHDITGFLLHEGDGFLQFLEGPALEVERLCARIRSDSRHCDFTIVFDERALARLLTEVRRFLART